jgi:hypothetical protein
MSKSKTAASHRVAAGDHLYLVPHRPHRSRKVQAVLWLWRWAIELVFAGLLTVAVARLHAHGWAWIWSIVAVAGLLLAPLALPFTRRFLFAVGWALVTRHRLRAFFIECRIYNPSGKLPWILLARPTKVGERCWLWLVPGLSIHDFEDAAEPIAAACWARTARVERHKSIGSLIRLDVVRRDPLSGGVLPSVLIPTHRRGMHDETAQATGPLDLPRQVIDLTTPLITEARTGSAARTGIGHGKTSGRQPSSTSNPITTAGGEDVSDYV